MSCARGGPIREMGPCVVTVRASIHGTSARGRSLWRGCPGRRGRSPPARLRCQLEIGDPIKTEDVRRLRWQGRVRTGCNGETLLYLSGNQAGQGASIGGRMKVVLFMTDKVGKDTPGISTCITRVHISQSHTMLCARVRQSHQRTPNMDWP